MEVPLYKLLTLGINDGDNEQHMTLKGLPGMLGPFFIYPNHTGKVSSDERRHYICNTFSHWMMKQFSQWLCPFSKTTQIENWTGIVTIYMMAVVVMMVIMMTTTTTMMMIMMMMRGGGGGVKEKEREERKRRRTRTRRGGLYQCIYIYDLCNEMSISLQIATGHIFQPVIVPL